MSVKAVSNQWKRTVHGALLGLDTVHDKAESGAMPDAQRPLVSRYGLLCTDARIP
jgi:hypothetical protein